MRLQPFGEAINFAQSIGLFVCTHETNREINAMQIIAILHWKILRRNVELFQFVI
jgi:hypothetical protein